MDAAPDANRSGKRSLTLIGPLQSTGTIQLPGEVAEELVLSAAREGFYAAEALDSPAVSQAQQCLALLPASAAVRSESDAISALLRLQRKHGYAMLPAAFKEVPSLSTSFQHHLLRGLDRQRPSTHP